MNGIDSIVRQLAPPPKEAQLWRKHEFVVGDPSSTKSGLLRQLLREHGPLTSRELTRFSGIQSSDATALLSSSMRQGRVRKRPDGKYEIDMAFVEGETNAIRSAIQYLKARGYTITKGDKNG